MVFSPTPSVLTQPEIRYQVEGDTGTFCVQRASFGCLLVIVMTPTWESFTAQLKTVAFASLTYASCDQPSGWSPVPRLNMPFVASSPAACAGRVAACPIAATSASPRA